MRRTFTLFLLSASLLIAGCGDDEGGGGPREAGKPKVEVPEGPPPRELQIKDLKVGTGAEAVRGRMVTVHYVGVAYSDEQQFDASWDSGTPFPFTLGAGEVIPGWDQGVVGMKVGGRRQLIIPPALAYREFGSGNRIKPNETLIFVIDLLEVA